MIAITSAPKNIPTLFLELIFCGTFAPGFFPFWIKDLRTDMLTRIY